MYTVLLLLILSSLTIGDIDAKLKKAYPPHCTQVTKDTDYVSRFKLDYPVAYIHPGVRETYQPMYCLHPPAVNKAVTVVCDWAAPPQVQFTLGDDYMHVMRQDPTGHYQGNAVITTYQLCSHNMSHVDAVENKPAVTPHVCTFQMYCLHPPAVNKAVTVVCDWAAPPQVQFTLGDDYMHVMRQDPTGRYQGNAVITTYQLCSHNMTHVDAVENKPAVTPHGA